MTRSQHLAPSSIRTGDLVVDHVAKTATVGGQPVHLGMKEYQLVACLSLHRDTVLTRAALLAHLYGTVDQPEIKIVDIFIDKLRRKLAHSTAHIVETSHAGVMGFRLIGPPP
jgi:two-component system cell cycle response regulator CtrA